jgi:preprotein translocase subunit SecG
MSSMGMLAAVTWWQGVVAVLFVLTCLFLILVILLQKGRGGGLAGAFGGAGGYSAFGAKTGDVFTWITISLTAMFVILAVLGNKAFVPPPTQLTPPPAAQQTQQPESHGPVSSQPGAQ